METIITVFCGVIIILIFLHMQFPFFLHDCKYIFKILAIRSRRIKYRKQKPFYTLLDCFLDAVKRHPEKPFIIFEDKIYSYQDVDRQSNKVGHALRAHSSLREGDTVALILGNEPCYAWIWLGLSKLGCAAALLNYNIRANSLLHCFSCSGATVVIAAAELKEAVQEVLPKLLEQKVRVFILSNESDTKGLVGLADKIHEAPDESLSPKLRSNVTLGTPALYFYTSGTTGLPKATMAHQDRLWGPALFLAMAGATSNDVIYITLPLYHGAGFLVGFSGAIERGITIVLRRKFSSSQFWDDCRKHNVTIIQYIGEIMRYLCNTQKRDNDREHKVRLAIGNGMRADVWQAFLDRFGAIDVMEFYAASDGNMSFLNYPGKVGAIGRVNFLHERIFPYSLIKYDIIKEEPVRNSNGFCIEIPKGETGLFVSKITNIAPFVGYAGNPKATEKKILRDVFQKGDMYFDSGDLLRIGHDNFIYFQDRVGDTFRWKGENVATNEVSDILKGMDCIADANVYGIQVAGHEGRIGMAAVTLQEGQEFDGSEAFLYVSKKLPSYARPHFIRIQTNMELTGTFKQVKFKLVKEGFDPACIQDPLYILEVKDKGYKPMTQTHYESIISGKIRL